MTKNNLIKLFISIIICQMAGVIGSIFTTPKIGIWYVYLKKPFLSPPNWVFGPVWTLLFILMGVSLWFVWIDQNKKYKKKAIIFFIIQLVLNILWSFLFFGIESPLLAFLGIICLWLAILFTILEFYKIYKIASYLLIPYIVWVSFASYLNLFIWIINK